MLSLCSAISRRAMHSRCRTPRFITSEILKLCHQLDATQKPGYVSVNPEPDCVLGECYDNVQRKADACGGCSRHGWNIEVWPLVLLDAQFHAVYVGPDDRMVDITPNQNKSSRILFLPDSRRRFTAEGGRILNERVPLSSDPEIVEYIALTNEKDLLETERGIPPKNENGPQSQIQRRRAVLLATLQFRYTPKRDPCPCDSGKRYLRCCYELPTEVQLQKIARKTGVRKA